MDDGSFATPPANARQVGGDHYKTPYEHWDFVPKVGLGYLAGCASKYLVRWRKKNGKQDLEKCLHYLEKAHEKKEYPSMVLSSTSAELYDFVSANEVHAEEAAGLAFILHGDYENASVIVRRLLASEE